MNEKEVQTQIVDYLRMKGWMVAITSQKGLSFASPGLPDLIAVKEHRIKGTGPVLEVMGMVFITPRTLWIEVKGPRGKQRPAQIQFQQDLEAQGGEYLLANSLDVVIDHLNRKGS